MSVELIKEMLEGFHAQEETCRIIETRCVDMYVLVEPQCYHALTTDQGVTIFCNNVDQFERTRDRKKIEGLLRHVKENNPDNPVAQSLVIMSWKKAARKQREAITETIQKLEAALKNAA